MTEYGSIDIDDEIKLFSLMSDIRNSKTTQDIPFIKSYFKSYSADISPFAKFKDIPNFPHKYFGIFISSGATIGRSCTIFQQVTIGSNLLIDSKKKGYPVIGDNVYIGAGAKIIGNVKIGDNVRIGANAVVYNDVPDNCVVTSSEMRIHKKENLDNRYFSYCPVNGWAYKNNGKWVRNLSSEEINEFRNLK